MLKSALLTTKLHCPPPPAHRVERCRLAQRLNDGLNLNRPLTLVSAPAGFGKTSCVGEWVRGLDGWPIAWLSLEPADDDPARFFAYLLGALQNVRPGVGQEIVGVLHTGHLPPAGVITATLLNDLLQPEDGRAGPLLLILDDFHVIQHPFILQVLEQLLDNLRPPLHLVLITREDPPLPLARLRAGNRLTEIRAGHLRFSDAEATRFLNDRLHLALSPADVARLQEKTEGWVVGLQLAGLALQGAPSPRRETDPTRFIASLRGSHRFILDYLTEQVLDRQPPNIRRFLLQTAILGRLNGDLCNAVTGREDGHSLLDSLFNANLFLVSLDDEGQWYRYHHLFADLLRSRHGALSKEEVAALHLRAARWYAEAGMADSAIDHALAAEAYDLAVELLETHALAMIRQGYAETVNGWLQAVPAAWRCQSTRTDLAFAWMHLLRGAYAEAAPYLEQVEAALAEAGPSASSMDSVNAEWLAMRSLVRQMEGDPAEGEKLARAALATAPVQDAHARSLAYFALGSVLRLVESTIPAVDAHREAIRQARAAGNPVVEMLSTVGLAGMAFEHGRLRLAVEITEPVVTRLEHAGRTPPISGVLYGILGEAHYQWHRLEDARRYSLRALQLSTLGGYNSGRIICRIYLARLAQMEGDLETATRELQQVGDLVPERLPDYVRQELVAQQVRLYLARNRPDAASLALQGEGFTWEESLAGERAAHFRAFAFPERPQGNGISHAAGLLYNSGLRLLLHEALASGDEDGLPGGVALAGRLLDAATEGGYLLVALEALLLRAQMRAAMGDIAAAAADYRQALQQAAPEGIVGVFVEQGPPVAEALATLLEQDRLGDVARDDVERIIALTHTPSTTTAAPEAPLEPLTERELEVLRLIAEGLKYKEIAAKLFISLNTVRFHIKAIYGKLGVNRRARAVEKARRLRLL